jgi:hypothetical protein
VLSSRITPPPAGNAGLIDSRQQTERPWFLLVVAALAGLGAVMAGRKESA